MIIGSLSKTVSTVTKAIGLYVNIVYMIFSNLLSF